jgi:hypothetical protein
VARHCTHSEGEVDGHGSPTELREDGFLRDLTLGLPYLIIVSRALRQVKREPTCPQVPMRLSVMQRESELTTVAVQDRLASLHQRDLPRTSAGIQCTRRKRTHLQVEVLQDLDERDFETWDLESVLDATNQSDRIDLCSDVLEQSTDES